MNTKTLSKYLLVFMLIAAVGMAFSPTALAQTQADCEPSDSTEWEVYEGEGVTLQLPDGEWEEVDLESAAEVGAEFMTDEMAFLAMFGSQQGSLLAVTSNDPSLSVLAMTLPLPDEEITIDNISALLGVEGLEDIGMIISEPRVTDLESGEAYVLDVAFEEGTIDLPISIFERFYLISGEEHMFMLLFVTEEGDIKDLCGDIVAVAESFTFDESMLPEMVSAVDGEWVTHSSDSVSISAPENWLDVSDPSFVETAIDLAGENNPVLENVMSQFSPDLFEIFLLDPVTSASVNLIAQDLGVAVPLDLMVDQMEVQYEQVLQANVISIDTVEIPAGEALRAHITLDVNVVGGGAVTQEQIQYIVIEGTWLYVISMGGPQTIFEEFEPIYDQIAESFEILN